MLMSQLTDRIMVAIKRRESLTGKTFNGADLARKCGIQRQTVAHWKSGNIKTIAAKNLSCVAKYFDVDPVWLSEGKGSIDAKPSPNTSGIDSKALSKSISLVEAVIKSGGYEISEDDKATIMAVIYDEIVKGDDISDREIELILKTTAK